MTDLFTVLVIGRIGDGTGLHTSEVELEAALNLEGIKVILSNLDCLEPRPQMLVLVGLDNRDDVPATGKRAPFKANERRLRKIMRRLPHRAEAVMRITSTYKKAVVVALDLPVFRKCSRGFSHKFCWVKDSKGLLAKVKHELGVQ